MENNASVASGASVMEATTLLATPGQKFKMEVKTGGSGLIAKVPVVLAQTKLQIYVDNTVSLAEAASEFIDVKQNVYLDSCELLPGEDEKHGKLLVSGFVRKNFQYASPERLGDGTVTGNIRYATVDVPFKCFTKIDYDTDTGTANNTAGQQAATVSSAPQSETTRLTSGALGGDRSAAKYVNSEKFSDKVYYELVESNVSQVTTKRDVASKGDALAIENTFSAFDEKMLVDMTLLVMQNQFVQLSSSNQSGQSGQSGQSEKKGGGEGGDKKKSEGDKDKKAGEAKKCDEGAHSEGKKEHKHKKGHKKCGKHKKGHKSCGKKSKKSSCLKHKEGHKSSCKKH